MYTYAFACFCLLHARGHPTNSIAAEAIEMEGWHMECTRCTRGLHNLIINVLKTAGVLFVGVKNIQDFSTIIFEI